MKTFNLALLTATTYASDYSIVRTRGPPVTYNLFSSTTVTSPIDWKMNVQSVYDNDTGYEWIEIEHMLTADIKETDSISFELGFTSLRDPWTDRVNTIAFDSALCNLAINSADKRFWVQTTTDQYIKCNDQACTGTETTSPDTTNDWKAGTNWIQDDDKENPFCTAHTNTDNTFKCSAIKCKYRRQMDTGDDKDF